MKKLEDPYGSMNFHVSAKAFVKFKKIIRYPKNLEDHYTVYIYIGERGMSFYNDSISCLSQGFLQEIIL